MTEETKKKLHVCAYCRVSTDEDTQATSYELQVQNYTKMIHENPEWEFAGIFADEGISGTSVLHREHFLEMIEKCKAGEIDLIVTKQVSRFARNVLDSLNYIYMLRRLDPPVGVYFEAEKLNTLDKSSDMIITVLSLVDVYKRQLYTHRGYLDPTGNNKPRLLFQPLGTHQMHQENLPTHEFCRH